MQSFGYELNNSKRRGKNGGGGGGALGLAFDPATASAGIVLTNNNTTASNPSGPLQIYSAKAKTSGTAIGVVAGYYFELVLGATAQIYVGLASSAFSCIFPGRVGITEGIAYSPNDLSLIHI